MARLSFKCQMSLANGSFFTIHSLSESIPVKSKNDIHHSTPQSTEQRSTEQAREDAEQEQESGVTVAEEQPAVDTADRTRTSTVQ